MPAAPSSPVPAVLAKLGPLHQHDTGRLRAHLQRAPDPRSRRGRPLAGLLLICACAVVSGARTITEITEWGQRATTTVLELLGIRRHLLGRRRAPSHATLTRLLAALDGDALDAVIGVYLAERDHTDAGTTGFAPRSAIAVDGKALSGSAHRQQRHRHLLSAVTHTPTVTLAQREVGAKTNETAAFRSLLEPLDLTGTVVAFDDLHSVKDQVRWLVQEKKAHYIAVIKGNQPTASAQIKAMPWEQGPVAHTVSGPGTGDGSPARSRPCHRGEPGRDRLPGSPAGPAHPPAPPGERQAADQGDGLRRHQPRYPPGQPR
ncbi:ISAs1 family transposase [Streptomyces phaeolivaceus]|uniref:ISAs1 family transposase n=1 Tax=Streptomyces phaeolivaceus TaxID=2653200 RepID=A0A5P8K9S8_9ACTN|nr:ISAs1 family transposase [Streptomyces phaeolivaceus]QFQ99377.1 ISAs1 family transposase [Streptomyces phaeolivaceus]